MAMPAGGPITQGYGQTNFALEPGGFHDGIDIGAGCGSPVVAAGGGRVIFAGSDGLWGNKVTIDHGNGTQTFYAHLASIGVSVGDGVGEGQQIGTVGSTGNSTGCHLHYGMHVNGQSVAPNYSPGGSLPPIAFASGDSSSADVSYASPISGLLPLAALALAGVGAALIIPDLLEDF